MNALTQLACDLEKLKVRHQYRTLPSLEQRSGYVWQHGHSRVNLSSNDYLALGQDAALQLAFLAQHDIQNAPLGACSSRLLTGSFPAYAQLENTLARAYGREAALVFNSGYHANIGILPALANPHTLILADKLVHASLIDGIRLAQCDFKRFRHNDMTHLTHLLEQYYAHYQRIIVVSESVFSMDGDSADLSALVALKRRFSNVLLYIDEAHSVGCYGEHGLGWGQKCGVMADIDLLVGTFGKAYASTGAFVVCDQVVADYLINFMRPLIFSTALSPLIVAWNHYLCTKMPQFAEKRQHLANISQMLRAEIAALTGQPNPSTSHIVPLIVGENQRAVDLAHVLQQNGFYCLPIRPPTVPQGTARIRFSLNAGITEQTIDKLLTTLTQLLRS
ncbi:aminotransferase class I/II-fold pyridoxal phosphate-dependent enzyme [Spirabiliibacterium falconis]|uniref:aminotransferase class I/II-fold pyridoxal phosphate-dependent enzyme n=1 Tax=Spirabiliibacterium falconis TaxID=572023 RepID=UPI001AAD3662|nr:8-amino-7-oxononanoate synthase [Spirabiliibacterium falconis]MBE2894338.1 8-amino-7-oxononanoate synthase [Spirabiliibacterium falconis]